jgi:hypothetical protein
MLRSLKQILGYQLMAKDKNLGKVMDFYFDDQFRTVRYLVADTGTWLPGRRVLIAPASVGEPVWVEQLVPLDLTSQEIENSPGIQEDLPISMRKEAELARYYGWPQYWEPFVGLGHGAQPHIPVPPDLSADETEQAESASEHLRSVSEILSYSIQARDDGLGEVNDLIAETDNWQIRMIVIKTGSWLSGRELLLPEEHVESIDWVEHLVRLSLSAEELMNSPEFDPTEPINSELEVRVYDYYGRPVPKQPKPDVAP